MNLFLLDSKEAAMVCRQLTRLDADCASLLWSRSIPSVPENVSEALETIQEFTKEKLCEICADGVRELTWSDGQAETLFAAFQKSAQLKAIMGSGVVLAGEEAETVQRELAGFPELASIAELLRTGKNLVLY